MIAKIIILEPSFILRKGIVALLEEHFPDMPVIESSVSDILSMISGEKDFLLLLSSDIYDRNKQFLEPLPERVLFLNYEKERADSINYLKTTEEEFLSLIEGTLGGDNSEEKDEILTDSERNVLKYIALGLSNKEIASKLFLSIHTVATHRKHITRKLDIKSVSGLTVYAILNKLVSINQIQQG